MKQTNAASYYPGHGDDTNPLDQLDSQLNHDNHDIDVEDYVNETEEDWMGDDYIAKGQPFKFSESDTGGKHIILLCAYLFDLTSMDICHSGLSGRE